MKKLLLLFCIPFVVCAQENEDTKTRFVYELKEAATNIVIDGVIGDREWNNATVVSNFFNHSPSDVGQAEYQTEVRVAYKDGYLYLVAKNYDNGKRVIQSLVRDNEDAHWDSDSFTLVLDPMNAKQSGFMFGVNAGGAEIEAGLLLRGANTRNAPNWDNKWQSKVKQYDTYWIVEMAIPFKTLRYNPSNREWGINFIRGDMEHNMFTTWTHFPTNFNGIDMNYMGTLSWDNLPKKAKGRFIFNPYITSSATRDFENNEETSTQTDIEVGGDIKVALNSSLNLDLTFSPDFSNADVDEQVTNISRFNIFLPEQRNFFLENSDIFASFGSWDVKPFFSRKIGIDGGTPIPITFGARLSGNVNQRLRIGVMDVQTKKEDDIAAQNYAVAAVHYNVLKRSTIKAIFINKQATSTTAIEEEYNRNAGLEFTYISKNGGYNTNVRYHTSIHPEKLAKNNYFGVSGNYNTRSLRIGWDLDFVGENYITAVGVNPRLENYNAETEETERLGYNKFNAWMRYINYVTDKNRKLNRHGPRTWHYVYLNPDGSFNESRNNLAYDFNYKNTSRLDFSIRYRNVNLMFPTALLGDSFSPLPLDSYAFATFNTNYESDNRKQFVYSIRSSYGSFFNGTRLNTSASAKLRFQPWGNFGLTYNYNDIKLDDEYGTAKIHLLRFNNDISFSNKIFLNTVVQYDSQSENVSIFSRLQWRFSPMSDLYVIYNENQGTEGLGIKNRALILKATYWF